MKYYITKEIGAGWQQPFEPSEMMAWAASSSQRRLAKRIIPGDTLLHYIDHAHAWAGYSTATGQIKANVRDSQSDWLAALPFVIPIARELWLDKVQCEFTVEREYHRRPAFSEVQAGDALRIMSVIKSASKLQSAPSEQFHNRWMAHAESYYKEIVKTLARGKCSLCGESAESWASRTNISLNEKDLGRLRSGFLDAAHIVADAHRGSMMPDNMRALCPNCHRVVDRLSSDRRGEILRSFSIRSK